MQKTLRFTKKPVDLSNNKEFGTTIVAVDYYRFYMKNYKSIEGHDDSLPFNGELWVKSVSDEFKPTCLAHCSNDGWGGTTCLNYTNAELAKTIEDKVKTFKWKSGNYKMNLSMDFIADILAITCDMLGSK